MAVDQRRIPSIDKLLKSAESLVTSHGRQAVVDTLRIVAEEARCSAELPEDVENQLLARAQSRLEPQVRPVINATGVMLHTNLGRAPLAPEALAAIARVGDGYSNLEFDLASGERGSRQSLIAHSLRLLSGREGAVVVNNCAAAMLLILDTFGRGREVVVSRGELVEIGGSYRIPDVLSATGATLVEVGTTNRTRLADYERVLNENTGILLSTHPSNFRVVGFTESVSYEDLCQLGRERGILSVLDLGSGAVDPILPGEPTLKEAAPFDLVAISGDKLLGGPQAGLIMGRAELVKKLRKNAMMRALRPGKLTLAALEATLHLHLKSPKSVPIVHMITRTPEELKSAAEELAERLRPILAGRGEVEVVEGVSSVGGGSLPGQTLPTHLVQVTPGEQSGGWWMRKLRASDPPVVCRHTQGKLYLDLRTLRPQDYPALEKAFT